MTTLDLWDPSIPLRVTVALFDLLVLGTAVGAAALLVNRSLSGVPAARRYQLNLVLLSILFFSLPVVVAFELGRGRGDTHEIARPMTGEIQVAESTDSAPTLSEATPGLPLSPKDALPRVPSPAPTSEPDTGKSDVAISAAPSPKEVAAVWIAGGYCAGVLVMVVRLLAALYGGRRLRQSAASIHEPWILELVKRQSRALGLHLVPAVACCERVAVPVVVGILRPVILLPMSFVSTLSPEELCDILTHELAHLRRLDHLAIVLQRVTEVLWFFHPAVWYLSRRITCEREYCCDDLALAAGVERLSYASSLCRVAEIAAAGRTSESLALAADGRRPSELRRRIVRLLEPRRESNVRLTVSGLIGLASLVAAIGLASLGFPTLSARWQSALAADGDTPKLLEQAKTARAENTAASDEAKMNGYVADARLPGTQPVVLWKFVSDVSLRSTATEEGMVYVSTSDGQVIALRATDGSVVWKYAIPGRDDALKKSKWDELNWKVGLGRPSFAIGDYFRVGRPAVDKDYVYFGTPSGVTAVRRDSGRFVWHRDIEHGVLESTPLPIGQRVYISGYDGKAYGLHRPTGHVVWQHDLVQDAPPDKPGFRGERARAQKVRARPMGAACDGKLFIQCVFDQSRIVAIDCLTGEKRWSYEMAGWTAFAPTIDGDRVYIGSQDRTLSCVSLESGKVLWKFVAPAWLNSRVAVHAGKVYLTCGGHLYQLDARTGKGIRMFGGKEDRKVLSESPLVDEQTVYVAVATGHLCALEVHGLVPHWDVGPLSGAITNSVTDGRRIFVTTQPDRSGAGEPAIVALGDASLAVKQPASRSRRPPSSSPAEPDDVAKHVALIKATETRPRGYASGASKTLAAVVMASDGTKSTLLSTYWGAAPFPIGKTGLPLGPVFLLDTEERVRVLNCDERRGIGVFSVNKPLPAIPESLMTGPLRPGDTLIPIRWGKQPDDAYTVTAVDQTFPNETATGQIVPVEHAVRLDRSLVGTGPCQCFLKDGKLAAICLDNFRNPANGRLEGYALPIDVARRAFADWKTAAGEPRPVPADRRAPLDVRPHEAAPDSPANR